MVESRLIAHDSYSSTRLNPAIENAKLSSIAVVA